MTSFTAWATVGLSKFISKAAAAPCHCSGQPGAAPHSVMLPRCRHYWPAATVSPSLNSLQPRTAFIFASPSQRGCFTGSVAARRSNFRIATVTLLLLDRFILSTSPRSHQRKVCLFALKTVCCSRKGTSTIVLLSSLPFSRLPQLHVSIEPCFLAALIGQNETTFTISAKSSLKYD